MRMIRLTLHPATASSRHYNSLCLSDPGITSCVTHCLRLLHHVTINPQWSTADTEIKISSVENPELTNVIPLKPGVSQTVATHASSIDVFRKERKKKEEKKREKNRTKPARLKSYSARSPDKYGVYREGVTVFSGRKRSRCW